MERKQVLNIIYIILIAGVLGGIGNYFMTIDKAYKTDFTDKIDKTINKSFIKNFSDFQFQKSIILGTIAAGVVPLFLNIISSDLLEFDAKIPSYKNYFIFGSLCLVASLFSNKFLTRVSDQILRWLRSVEDKADNAKINADAAIKSIEVEDKKKANFAAKYKADEEFKNKVTAKVKSVESKRISDSANKTAKAYGLSEDAKSVYAEILGKRIVRKGDLRAKLESKDVDLKASIKQLNDKGLIQELTVDAPNDYIHLKSE